MAKDEFKLKAKNRRGQELRTRGLNRKAQGVGFDSFVKLSTAIYKGEYNLKDGIHVTRLFAASLGEVEVSRSSGELDEQEGQFDYFRCVCVKETLHALEGFRIQAEFKFCPDCGAKIEWIDDREVK